MQDFPRPRTAHPSVITVRALCKRYGSVVAVDDATFEVARGEFFSLLGPSGCGKTTLLRLLAGFEAADGGTILLEDADVSRVPPYRRNVNTVFQQYALFPHLTVAENVAFGPRAKALPRAEVAERVARMLTVVRLEDLSDRRPHQLSGGQRQRVALARALVNMPSALLLDEPLSALDLKLRQAMQLELKRIQREVGITFVFVTHDQDEALTMSDRVAVMRAGRIEQVGTPEEVYREPRTAYVAGFIGSANLLPALVESVHGDAATVRVAGAVVAGVAVGGGTFVAGDAALVLVRPERVTLHATRPPSGVALPATLTARTFQGPVVRCDLRGPDGVDVVAHERPDGPAATLAAGSALWATFEPHCARLLALAAP